MKYVATLLAGIALGIGGLFAVQAVTTDGPGESPAYRRCVANLPKSELDRKIAEFDNQPTTEAHCRAAQRAREVDR